MGTTNSRIGSNAPSSRVNRIHRTRSLSRARLASLLICGCSTSKLCRRQMERSVDDRPRSSKDRHHVDNSARRTLEDTISERGGPTESSTSNAEAGASSETESSDVTSEYLVVSHGLRSNEMNKEETHLMRTKDLHHSSRMGVEINRNGYVMDASDSVASTSFREEESSHLVNTRVNKESNNDIENSVNASASLPSRCLSRRSCSQEFSHVSAYELPDETFLGENRVGQDNNSLVDPARVDPVGNASVTSNVELVVSGREQNGRNEHMPAVEPVSASSNFSSITNNDSSNFESRHNRTRLFSDASSVNSSERLTAYPDRDFSNGNDDNRSSQNTRHVESNGYLSSGARVNNRSRRRQHSRSEIWDVLYGNFIENQQQNNLCPFGVHPDGSCSCDSVLTGEESSIHLSISRIVMLAEALFEVLDEIQPRSASFPLPLASHAAPESVVDSFPLREYSKRNTAESPEEVQQCYICLSEYEDGDKIRILPCDHEYHMACVDKWLKQIQGVCPLCRGDVAQGSHSTD